MRVHVGFYGAVRDVVGVDGEVVDLPACTDVRGLLERLAKRHGSALREKVLQDNGTMWPSVAVLINGSNVSLSRGLDTPLVDGDTVAIVPVIAGGW